ncbi:MAG: hypothetical protein D6689_20650 [Deltaproteobacteria bacterium]|nr:MAG: hypothetical protein D6689_20650 [Deltaproteobacteria bacterium]
MIAAGAAVGGALSAGAAQGTAVAVALATATVLAAWGALRGAQRVRGVRAVATVAAAAILVVIARATFGSIATARELASLPPWLASAIGGAAFGLIGAVALVPRHVRWSRDRVAEAARALRGAPGDEVSAVAARAVALWRRVDESATADDATRAAVQDAVLEVLATARQWRAAAAGRAVEDAAALAARLDALDRRGREARDPVARAEYARARAAVAEQLRYAQDIDRSRERVLARMHGYLAVIEQVQLAAVNAASARVAAGIADTGELAAGAEPPLARADAAGDAPANRGGRSAM